MSVLRGVSHPCCPRKDEKLKTYKDFFRRQAWDIQTNKSLQPRLSQCLEIIVSTFNSEHALHVEGHYCVENYARAFLLCIMYAYLLELLIIISGHEGLVK